MKPIRMRTCLLLIFCCTAITFCPAQQLAPGFIGQWSLKKIGVDTNNNGKIEPGEISKPPFTMQFFFNNDNTGKIMVMGTTGATFKWAMKGNNDIVVTESDGKNKAALAKIKKVFGPSLKDNIVTFHIEQLTVHLFNASFQNSAGQLTWYYFKK